MEIHPLLKYLLDNGGKEGVLETWAELAARFNVAADEPNQVRRAKIAKDRWGRFKSTARYREELAKEQSTNPDPTFYERRETGEEIVTDTLSERLYTVEEMAAFHKIDLEVWESAEVTTNYWEVGAKMKRPDKSTYIVTKPLHQLKVRWKRRDTARADFEERRQELESSLVSRSLGFELPPAKNFETWVVAGCVHVPAHNRRLWEGLLTYIQKHKPDGIILAGDFLDMKALSDYDKDKVQETNLWQEYLEGYKALLELESALTKKAKRVFLFGNHENRYFKHLKRNEGARYGEALISPQKALRLEELNWQVLKDWQNDYVLLGNDLEVIHGTLTSQNAAAAHLAKSSVNGRSVVFFHTHRMATATTGRYGAWNCGSLADFENETHFSYVDRHTKQGWQNGFAIVTVDEKGETYVNPVKCSKDGFFLNGKKY